MGKPSKSKNKSDDGKRNCLTVEQKLKVIERLNNNISLSKIASEFKVSKTQIFNVKASKENILNGVSEGILMPTAKTLPNRSKQIEIDNAVFKWFKEMRKPTFRCKPLAIARSHIQARAMVEAERMGIEGFRASNGWFSNWRKRNGVGRSLRLYGEAGDVTYLEFEAAMAELREKLEEENYEPDNIFNMDETGMFYRAMPARTYLAPDESRKTVRGTKSLKAKDRVTVLFCVNATGNYLSRL